MVDPSGSMLLNLGKWFNLLELKFLVYIIQTALLKEEGKGEELIHSIHHRPCTCSY